MTIVMDFRKYDGVIGGVEQAVIQVSQRVAHEGHIILLLTKLNRLDEVKKIFTDEKNIIPIPLAVKTHAISIKNILIDSINIPRIARRSKASLIHFPYNWSFPFRTKLPTILTIHDVIPFTYREAMGLFRHLIIYKPAIRFACRLNTVITTVSEFSRQDIHHKVGAPLEKIEVIPNGIRTLHPFSDSLYRRLNSIYHLDSGYILNVGGIHERKNIVRLIDAFAKLIQRYRYPGNLVITGSVSGAPYQVKMKKRCDSAIKSAKLENRVIFTGFIPDEELDTLLHKADIFIYPSLYEGFGIPVLEAMNAEIPVITSNSTALKEVAGDAALLTDPESSEDMCKAMQKVLTNPALRQQLIRKGKVRASSYSWDTTAQLYLSLYRRLSS